VDLLNRLIVAFDRRQRRKLGIWEFTDDPDCIVRLGITRARVGAHLADGTIVRPGDRIGVIHLWNEHVPRIPPGGGDLGWARTMLKSVRRSLLLLAPYLREEPRLQSIDAFGGEFGFVYSPAAMRVLTLLGFELFDPLPPRTLWDRTVDLAMRIWPYLLRRAFNPESLRDQGFSDLRRRPIWITRSTILARYGTDDDGVAGRISGAASADGSAPAATP